MAVIDELEDDEEQTGGATQTSSGPSVVAGGQQPSDQSGASSGSYTNFQKYIEANNGRDFGGQVAGKIDEGTNSGLANLGDREADFTADVDKNTLSFDDGLKQKITDAPQSLSGEDRAMATNLRTKSYAGRTDFGGELDDPYADLRKQFSGLKERKDTVEKPGGKTALLGELYGRPSYTEGEKSLDSFILSNQKEPVDAAMGRVGSAVDKYGTTKDRLNTYAGTAKGKSDAANSSYRSLLGLDSSGNAEEFKRGSGQQGLIQKDLEKLYGKADARKTAAATQYGGAKAAGLDLKNPNAGIYQNFGGAERLYGIDPTAYLNRTPEGDINYKTTASPEEAARLNALTELGGMGQGYMDPKLAGTMDDEALVNFDLEKFNKDVGTKKSGYDAEMAAAKSPFLGTDRNLEQTIADNETDYGSEGRRSYVGKFDPLMCEEAYQDLLKQREDIRKRYGYHDLVNR